jgi:hypothetical protein
MILVPLPYKLYGYYCLCLNMENLLYKSKSEQGVANLLCLAVQYYTVVFILNEIWVFTLILIYTVLYHTPTQVFSYPESAVVPGTTLYPGTGTNLY